MSIHSNAEITSAIERYWSARMALIAIGEQYPYEFGGNDNLVGRIGEYLALGFLRTLGQAPRRPTILSNPGYDFIEGEILTQVKTITPENIAGRLSRLKDPWTQLVIIVLDESHQPQKIGVLTAEQHAQALRDHPTWSKNPVIRRSMLASTGIVGRYGTVYSSNDYLPGGAVVQSTS